MGKRVEKKRPQVEQDLRDFRSGTADASDVFRTLEGKSYEDFEMPEGVTESKDSFLLKYILTVVQDCHLKESSQDLVLLALGLLTGYEDLGVQERRVKYCRWVGTCKNKIDRPFDAHWENTESLQRNMSSKENIAINHLFKKIEPTMRRNGGVLGYACQSEKIKEICGKTFPQPFYLQGKGYRKCESNGRIFYIPLTAAEQRKLASQEMSVSDTTSNGFAAEPSIELAPEPPLYEPPPVSPPDTPPRGWTKLPTKLKEFVSALSLRRKAAYIACLCVVIFLFIYAGILLQGGVSTGQNQGSLDDALRLVTDEDIADIIQGAQAPIVVCDETGEYETEEMLSLIKQRILDNPIYGDLVAQGLIGADTIVKGNLQEHNPWLLEFVEKTDAAMDSPEQSAEGMRKWLLKSYGMISVTDEYKDYADKLCRLLDYFSVESVTELNTTNRWHVELDASGVYARAVESSEQTSQTALVLVHRQANAEIEYMVDFSIEDGSITLCNPWKLGVGAFAS